MEKKDLENIKIAAEFQQHLKDGSDRTCTLLAASFLESELERVLKAKLVGDDAFKYKLFDSEEPLGSFPAKIKMCFSLGFISEQTMINLDTINLLKNEFENYHKAMTFEDHGMTEQVYDLPSIFYLKYEAEPRQYFCNVALNTLTFILSGYKMKKFKEKSHPVYGAAKEQEMRKSAEEMADQILNVIKSN